MLGADALQSGRDTFGHGVIGGRDAGYKAGLLGFGGQSRCVIVGSAQDHAVVLNLCFDPAVDLTFGNTVQHGGIGHRGFGTEIAVTCGQIAEILRNRLHGIEGIVKPLQCAREGAIGYG